MTGLLAAQRKAGGAHGFQHIPVSYRRHYHGAAFFADRLMQPEITHDRRHQSMLFELSLT